MLLSTESIWQHRRDPSSRMDRDPVKTWKEDTLRKHTADKNKVYMRKEQTQNCY